MFYLNGKCIDESSYVFLGQAAKKSKNGVFETIACFEHKLPLQAWHENRLIRSSSFVTSAVMRSDLENVILPKNGVVKYQVFYSDEAHKVCRLIEVAQERVYPIENWIAGVDVCLTASDLSSYEKPLGKKFIQRAIYKEATKKYLAMACAETLILNELNLLIEGTKTNIFLIKDNQLITPQLDSYGVAGVMRAYIIQLASKLGLSLSIQAVNMADLSNCDAVFLTNALIGIWPVRNVLDETGALQTLQHEHPILEQLKNNLPVGFVRA